MKDNTKLPREEWNFSELDKEEVLLAFFYEYGRSSGVVKKEVEKMRTARPHPRVWPYCPRQHHLYDVLHWLAEQEPYFPETPWLILKKKTIAEIQKGRAEARNEETRINVTLPPGQKWYSRRVAGSSGDPVRPIEWMCRALRGSNVNLRCNAVGFSHVWMGNEQEIRAWQKQQASTFVVPPEWTIQLKPESGIISGGIDWQATDEEIMEQFAWFLERVRPASFKGNAKTPLVQRGFDTSLPFRKGSALDWLGIYRQRRSVGTWRKYFQYYNPQALCGTRKSVVRSRDVSELARPREEDCRKAKLILDWFDNGKPLRRQDFK